MTERRLPQGFIARLQRESPQMFDRLEAALTTTEPDVAIRANMAKGWSAAGSDRVPWCDAGIYLPVRPQFTLDPALHQGLYYVQDASSMFIAMVARQISAALGPVRWLDACAAPGGKSTCVADNLAQGSVVVANELVPARAAALRENIVKWGNPAVIVTRADSRSFGRLRNFFDVVAADVPCSGEGMMRKDPDAVSQWSEALIERCAAVQREIVDSLWEAVAPGGFMVYSTCTFNRCENEEMVGHIVSDLGGEIVRIDGVDPSWGIVESEGGYRFIPGRLRGEGLFMALISKPGQRPNRASQRIRPVAHAASGWIDSKGENIIISAQGDRVNACQPAMLPVLKEIEQTKGIDIIHHGTVIGRTKGRDLIPDHSLAMSTLLRREAFPQVDLSTAEALSYLRCDTITLPSDTPRGHVLLTHAGYPLGFAKHLGNRTNSLYPREWRIHI